MDANFEKNVNKKMKEIKDINLLEEKCYNFFNEYSFKPDREQFPYPKIGEVLDEEKSVKWNREEVYRLREAHDEKVKDLQKKI